MMVDYKTAVGDIKDLVQEIRDLVERIERVKLRIEAHKAIDWPRALQIAMADQPRSKAD